MKEKLANILTWSITIILASVIAYLVIRGLIRRQSLNKNWEYAQAIVIDDFSSSKYTDYLDIHFLSVKMYTKEVEHMTVIVKLF